MTAILKACLVAGMLLGFPQSVAEAKPDSQEQELRCLATTVYYESRGEPAKGQRGVADVVLNRAYKQGKSICQVVHHPAAFSYLRAKPRKLKREEIKKQLEVVFKQKRVLDSRYAHFYSGKAPKWALGQQCKKIGNHHFCKLKEKENAQS